MKDLLFSSQGRINRSRFWLAGLGTSLGLAAILAIVLTLLWQVIPGTIDDKGGFSVDGLIATPYLIASLGYVVVSFWTAVCLGIKRYHDLDKSGAWMLVMFVPLIGSVVYFIQAGCLRGTSGTNRYGSDPLAT